MARSGVNEVATVADPALLWNFDLFMPAIPGSGDTRDLTWKCMTTALPGSEIDRVDVQLHGIHFIYAGRRNWSHSFTTGFLEAVNWQTRTKMFNWMESARSWANNSGSEASVYKVNSQIVLYDDVPNVAKTIKVFGMWPQAIADVSLDGSQGSGHVTLEVTWAYDYTDS